MYWRENQICLLHLIKFRTDNEYIQYWIKLRRIPVHRNWYVILKRASYELTTNKYDKIGLSVIASQANNSNKCDENSLSLDKVR